MREPLARNEELEARRRRRPIVLWSGVAIAAIAVVAGGLTLFRVWPPWSDEPTVAPPVVAPPAATNPTPGGPPAARSPAVEPEPPIPLPPLDESDADVASSLTESFGGDVVTRYQRPEGFVRNVVVTIDNLPRATVTLERRPIQPTSGPLIVRGAAETLELDAANYARYTPFTTVLARTDARLFVGLYRRYYPLLQQAYVELGNPDTDFDTRVIEVIDHLLATPEIEGPIALAQPNVLYTFRDPALESLSAGQKILIRMGPEHSAVVKAKLREIRGLLAQ